MTSLSELSDTLFNAILAMDSYNKGYDASIVLPDGTDGSIKIGEAAIVDNSTEALGNGVDSSIGFYALAYSYDGDIIISYRGTDYPVDGQETAGIPNDIYHGWTLGTGDLSSVLVSIGLHGIHHH